MAGYSVKVMQYFREPKNVGKMENPSVVAIVGSVACGDMIKLYLKVDEVDEVIKDASFESYGCAANIATSVAVTELAKGKSVDEAGKLTFRDVEDFLGGLPKIKAHCAVLSVKALRVALTKYRVKTGKQAFDMKIAKELLNGVIDLSTGKSVLKSDKLSNYDVNGNQMEITLAGEKNEVLQDIENQIRDVFADIGVELSFKYGGT